MAVITGVLKGPIGDARVGVVIELRAVRTSASVVIQARSQSVTDATGRYTLSVEPGQYDVMITASGRQPERVGAIQVMVNSATGTLNDFLLIPGESDLNPAIVATVDQMRAEAAESAAAAKVSENNSSAAMTSALSKVVTTDQSVASSVTFAKVATFNAGSISKGTVTVQSAAADGSAVVRFKDNDSVEQGSLYSVATGGITLRWGGAAHSLIGQADGSLVIPKVLSFNSIYSTPAAVMDIGIPPTIFRGSGSAGYVNPSNINIGTDYGFAVVPTTAQASLPTGITRGAPVFYVNARQGTAHALNNIYVGTSLVWHGGNTTVDANGFIKKASPIVKLFGTGESELNDESQGVTTERVSEGVYRVSGTLGFNSDAEWGGVDGGIEIPTDRNKLPLVWVDYEVDATGDLLIKTFHRINSTAPKFAQNVKVGYKEGQPIDIPDGRWIDLRVEMPGGDEPEYVPEPEPENEVILEPEQSGETEQEGQELVQEEPTPGEADPAKEPKE